MKLKKAAEDYLGEKVTRGRHHRARVLQRRAAPGDEGRRPHRGPRREAHRQRADGRGARVRPRQEEGRGHRRLRLRRRHVRHLDPRGRRQRRPGHLDQRRHAPRRRRHRQPDHRLDDRRVQEGERRRSAQRQDGAAAPQGGRGEGEDRALERPGDEHQPAVRHRRRTAARCTSTCASRARSSSR